MKTKTTLKTQKRIMKKHYHLQTPVVVSIPIDNQNPFFIKANENNKKTKIQDFLKMESDPANNVIKLQHRIV